MTESQRKQCGIIFKKLRETLEKGRNITILLDKIAENFSNHYTKISRYSIETYEPELNKRKGNIKTKYTI